MKKNNTNGSAYLLVLFLAAVISMFLASYSTRISNYMADAGEDKDQLKAYYIAKSGVYDAYDDIKWGMGTNFPTWTWRQPKIIDGKQFFEIRRPYIITSPNTYDKLTYDGAAGPYHGLETVYVYPANIELGGIYKTSTSQPVIIISKGQYTTQGKTFTSYLYSRAALIYEPPLTATSSAYNIFIYDITRINSLDNDDVPL